MKAVWFKAKGAASEISLAAPAQVAEGMQVTFAAAAVRAGAALVPAGGSASDANLGRAVGPRP